MGLTRIMIVIGMMIIVMMLLPRYIRVRYEDLASNTSSVLRRLYGHLGLSYTAQVEKEVYNHTHGGTSGTNGRRYPIINR